MTTATLNLNFKTLGLTIINDFFKKPDTIEKQEAYNTESENHADLFLFNDLEKKFCETIPSLMFRTLGLEILDRPSHIQKKIDRLQKFCSECGSNDFYEDFSRGEKICTNCGIVFRDHRETYMPPRNFENDDRIQHEVFDRTFKRKSISPSDLQLCTNPTNFKRRMRVDGYYDSKERKRNEVDLLFKRIKKPLRIPDYVIDHAWKHYRNLEGMDVFVGKRMLDVCSAFIYVALLQCNRPIQMQKYSNEISNHVGELTKKNLRKAKNHLFYLAKRCGYDIGKEEVMIDTRDMIQTTINYIRAQSNNKTEREFTIIQIQTEKILAKVSKLMRFYGAITSTIPSIMYYVSKRYTIPLTYGELVKATYVSSQSIRKKYKILIDHLGHPRKKQKIKQKMIVY